ncbi:hypothetical protein X946_4309 [Burkholderia sp. ABCPW 111]|nr:hypothetical protein X946_4309 [Burkholderia sp. ABCPW 111]
MHGTRVSAKAPTLVDSFAWDQGAKRGTGVSAEALTPVDISAKAPTLVDSVAWDQDKR